jgi:hypothetical protein
MEPKSLTVECILNLLNVEKSQELFNTINKNVVVAGYGVHPFKNSHTLFIQGNITDVNVKYHLALKDYIFGMIYLKYYSIYGHISHFKFCTILAKYGLTDGEIKNNASPETKERFKLLIREQETLFKTMFSKFDLSVVQTQKNFNFGYHLIAK